MIYRVQLRREFVNRPQREVSVSYARQFANRAVNGPRGRGWQFAFSDETVEQVGRSWIFQIEIEFTKVKGRRGYVEANQWKQIYYYLQKSAKSSRFQETPWEIKVLEGPTPNSDNGEEVAEKKTVKDYGTIHLEKQCHFEHIFDREAQIVRILSSLEAAQESDWNSRYHCVLYGPPGCGKTEILRAIAKMLGEEGSAYMMMDATSTTQAGALRLLMDSPFIPPVLIVEEIEKAEDKSLRWLLGLLDTRGEIRKTNFRVGNQARNVKMLCLATVNDITLFQRVMSGALASRFAHKIYCPRPSRDVLRKILLREVVKAKGNTDWIEPALEFCIDEMGLDDPRQVIPICICGRERLLDGTYQEAIRHSTSEELIL